MTEKHMHPMASLGSAPSLADIYAKELEDIRCRRSRLFNRRTGTHLPSQNSRLAPTSGHSLVGLAFSGGGIRSATFNLGVLQALSQFGLLRHTDYLSTVSGGGYIGSTLSAIVNSGNGQAPRRSAAGHRLGTELSLYPPARL